MVHGVAAGCLAVDLLVVDLVVLGDFGELLGRGHEREEARVEVAHVGLEHRRGVALRVHRDEQTLHAVAVLSEQLLDFSQLRHGGRTHVRTLREAEEHHHDLSAKVLDAALLAIVVGQLEVARVVRARDVHRLDLGLLLRAGRKKRKAAQRCRQTQEETFVHGGTHRR